MRSRVGIALMLSAALMFGSVNVNAAVSEELPMVTTETTENLEDLEEVTVPDETEDNEEVTVPDETEDNEEVTVPDETEDNEEVTVPDETEDNEEVNVPDGTEDNEEVTVPSEPEKPEEPDTPITEEPEDKEEAEIIATYGPVTVLSDGNAYLSDENGNRITTAGTPKVAGNKYYVAADGYLRSGWLYLGSWKMYFDTTTYVAKTGMSDIEGKKYLFNDDGVMENFAGTPVINGKKYWFSTDNASLKTGWLNLGRWKMYFDPETYAAKIGMADIDGHRYLFNKDGVMENLAGTPVIDGKKYWFSTEGYLKTGWLNLGQWKMYFDPETYAAKIGLSDIEGKKYIFNNDGVMENFAGTPVINGKKYWFSTDNASLKTGWLNLGEWKMYFDPTTYQGAVGITKIDGEYYYFNKDCIMETGFLKIGKSYYYFESNGVMLRNGSKVINGKKLEFGPDGVCTTKVFLDNYNGPYQIKVDRTRCVVTIYGDDGSGRFEYPLKAFVCSVGTSATPTPKGTFYTGRQQAIKELMGPSWGQYSTHVVNGVYFHSVATPSAKDPGHNVPAGEYYKLGRPASHGCIRLLVGDAYWMYKNIKPGTKVIIGDNFPMPLGKPSVPQMVKPGVDPTDPFNK